MNTVFCFGCIIVVPQSDNVAIFEGGTHTETGVPIPKQGNIKCSFSKFYESITEVQENQKGNSGETQPKHKKPEEKQRKTKRNTGK